MSKNVLLDTVSKVQGFCAAANMCAFDVDVVSGRYTVDAKSLMGIFSLNLSNKVEVKFSDNVDSAAKEKFLEAIKPYTVD